MLYDLLSQGLVFPARPRFKYSSGSALSRVPSVREAGREAFAFNITRDLLLPLLAIPCRSQQHKARMPYMCLCVSALSSCMVSRSACMCF